MRALTTNLATAPAITFALALVLVACTAAADSPTFAAADDLPRVVDASPTRRHARERLVEIQQRIQAALRYPPLARERKLEGTALLRFDIDRAGVPHEVVVHASSGRASLDRAATAAVADAAPLPWVYGRLEVPVLFSLETRR